MKRFGLVVLGVLGGAAFAQMTLMSAGCAVLRPGSVRFDPEPDLEEEVLRAARRIHDAMGVEVAVGSGDRDLVVPVRRAPPSARPGVDGRSDWSGHFDGTEIVVNEELSDDALPRTVLHEMIHALMLSDEHLPTGSVMATEGPGDSKLSVEDLEWICQRVPCRWMRPEA